MSSPTLTTSKDSVPNNVPGHGGVNLVSAG